MFNLTNSGTGGISGHIANGPFSVLEHSELDVWGDKTVKDRLMLYIYMTVVCDVAVVYK